MNWYLKVLKQYADFNGRSRRKEYWMFLLFNMIFSLVAIILDNVIGTTIPVLEYYGIFGTASYGILHGLYVLAVLIPGLAAGVRRLHDVGKSGWMTLIALIPLIGGIWLIALMATGGNPGRNKYGANPKEVAV